MPAYEGRLELTWTNKHRRLLAEGWLVAAHGELAHREWTAEDGGKRSAHSIVGNVDFLAAPRSDGTGGATARTGEAVADEEANEIPF